MAKDENVISLDERRRGAGTRKGGRRQPSQPAGEGAPQGESAQGGQQQGGRTTDTAAADARPVPGRLVWLYCPTCRSIEYTELALSGGRVHNVCGTVVHEAPVELDLRAEATLAQVNLERLEILQSLLDSQRQRYVEYRHRLNLAAGRPLEPYPAEDDRVKQIAEGVDAFGLLVSPFFQDPARRFTELAGEDDAGRAPEPGLAPSDDDDRPPSDD